MLAFLLIAAAGACNLAVCFIFMDAGGRFATEIAYAGEFRAVFRELTLCVREGFVNDGVLGDQETIWRTAGDLKENMQMLHRSLMFGNTTMGLPGFINRDAVQDSLWFDDSCLHINGTAGCRAESLLDKATFDHGLQGVLDFFYFMTESSLAMGSCGEAACGPFSRDRMENTVPLMLFQHVADIYIANSLEIAVDLLVDETAANVARVTMVETIILAFNIVFLVSLYVFLFYPMLVRLESESGRTMQLLTMYPRAIVMEIPYLCSYFVKVRQ
mmetsp:Transcript_35315/g.57128  ORF Transcript_35315/g.57128 Transcript_35315/m.57128 type:complete len:272 (+) Transcript_35315:2146-2961(+)